MPYETYMYISPVKYPNKIQFKKQRYSREGMGPGVFAGTMCVCVCKYSTMAGECYKLLMPFAATKFVAFKTRRAFKRLYCLP